MAITLDDLTVNFRHLNRDTLLKDWQWLIGPSKLPILLSRIGNAFVQDSEDDSVHLLNVGTGELLLVADSAEEFQPMLSDREFVMNAFAVQTIVSLQKAGITLKKGQIYSFKTPPILGGEYTVENLEATDIEVHFSVLGQICQQVKNLPPGTAITDIQIETS